MRRCAPSGESGCLSAFWAALKTHARDSRFDPVQLDVQMVHSAHSDAPTRGVRP